MASLEFNSLFIFFDNSVLIVSVNSVILASIVSFCYLISSRNYFVDSSLYPLILSSIFYNSE
nr:MAG TPA: hypothetical protein [Caudoviricetes sp.]